MTLTRDRIEALARWLREQLPEGAGLSADSRRIRPGDAFFAYPGSAVDGRAHLIEACARGAAALLVEPGLTGLANGSVPMRELAQLRHWAGPIADAFYRHPSAQLDVVGVTGTNGKTSCSHWIAQGLQQAGQRAAVVGTLGAGLAGDAAGGALTSTGLTTPDALALQALLARFVQERVETVALEASSIGLDQGRLDGTLIRVAVYTQLSRDHLDYHGSMQAYAEAKARLFAWPGLRAAVVNLDDPCHAQMLDRTDPDVLRIGYRLADAGGAVDLAAGRVDRCLVARRIVVGAQGMRISLEEDGVSAVVETPLIGRFNVSNLLATAGAWRALGLSFETVVQRLSALRPVPGRLQPVPSPADRTGPLTVVDYAHTPDALTQVLAALRPLAQARGGRLWCVFGAGGDRDPGKRPLMAAAVAAGADAVVLTSDNPRSESPQAILDALEQGLSAPPALREVDRARAIALTLARADDADVVLIAGKGHEATQEIAGVLHAFSDVDHARAALQARPLREVSNA